MIEIRIDGETPSKKNVNKFNIRTKTVYKDAKYVKWHTSAMLQMHSQIYRMEPIPNMIDTPVSIYLSFFHGDNRRRDSDNQTSSIMDLLQDCKVLKDDNWNIVREIHIKNYKSENNAYCLIKICSID